MVIREFNIDDINNGVLSVLSEVWQITEITDETIEQYKKNGNILYVIEYEGKVIGCATLHLQKKLIRNGGIAGFIEDVAIKNEYRGNGFGSKLIKKLIERSKNEGCYKITLSCFPERENFYIKNGFFNESLCMRYNIN